MKNKSFILAISLFLISLISLVLGFYNQWHFEIRFYIGLFFLAFSILSFVKFKKIANHLFGIILLLGFFNLIHFFPFSFSINFFLLKFHLIPFLFLISFCFLHWQKIIEKINDFNTVSDSEEFNSKNKQIEFFKNQFQNFSEIEIDKKLKEDLVPEAIEALKILKDNLTTKNTK